MSTVTIDPVLVYGEPYMASVIRYAVLNAADEVIVARTNAGVTESPAGSGIYHVANGISVDPAVRQRIIWDDGDYYASESLDVHIAAAAGATSADLTTAKNEIVAAMPGTIDPRGTGADQCTQIILGEDDAPVADAQVWITSDAEGANVVAGTLITNSSGEVFPLLDDGESYYRWAQKDGMNPIRAQAFTAVKDA
jgi:hypothetical protein